MSSGLLRRSYRSCMSRFICVGCRIFCDIRECGNYPRYPRLSGSPFLGTSKVTSTRNRYFQSLVKRIAPDWRQALSLKKTIEDHIAKDGVIGIGITATAVGLIAGGIAAALARKN